MKFDFKKILPHIVSLLVIVTITAAYFFPQFEGKKVRQNDLQQYQSMIQEIKEYRAKGDDALWSNSMFGGMPTYQTSPAPSGNQLSYVQRVMKLGISDPAGSFILGMLGFYIMMLLLGVNPWLSLIGALIFGLSTNNVILWEAGHATKMRTIMLSPLVVGGLIMVFDKRYVLGGAVFALALGLNIRANHIQMTYILGLCCSIFVIIELVKAVRTSGFGHYFKALGVLAIAAVLALGANAANLMTTLEYSKDTMRGETILEASSTAEANANSSTVDGLAWDYAMGWSNGTLDLLSSYIPGVAGGGSSEPISRKSDAFKKLRTDRLPLYWGDLPFTSGPIYFGAIAFFLFLFGSFVYKGEVKWWLVGAVVLTLIMSMGKYSFINRLFFDYLPLFNKFRTPNSTLSVTVIFIPVLALLGLDQVLKAKDKKQYIKPLFISAGILAGVALILAAVGGSLFDFSHPNDARNFGGNQQVVDLVADSRASLLSSSAFRSAMLILIAAGMIYFFIKEKISGTLMMGVVLALTIFDLFQIDQRYLSHDEFQRASKLKAEFTPRPVDSQILQDSDPHYRVYDGTIQTFQSASTSYYHKTIGGYHPAKLQRYADIIDRHITRNNVGVLSMLNTKYFIIPGQNNEPVAQTNPGAFGNAWLVSDIVMVDNANAEIDSLTGNDLRRKAFIHKEFSDYVGGLDPDAQGTIGLTSYAPSRLEYKAACRSEQFANFSEVWYGPDKGWQAYIDGEPVDHIRTNYILRGLKIPEGDHTIVFEFKPSSYYTGKTIGIISSILILLGVAFAAFSFFRSLKDEDLAA